MVSKYSLKVVSTYMGYIQNAAESSVRKMLKKISHAQGLKEIDTVYAEDFL